MVNRAGQEYWNREYRSCNLHIAKKRDIIRRWIESHVAPAGSAGSTCLEIGCYPGRFLAVFGELGYELFGVDFAADLAALPAWLEQRGYRVGSFWAQDFSCFAPERKFDLVASFGFIEHFTDWEEILARHAALVDDKGCLVIEAPNFTGAFQHWLHSGLDQLNYARHHIPAMDIAKWAAFLQRSGFDITYCGYFGAFRFWTEPQPRTLTQRSILAGLRMLQPALRLVLPPDRKAYAPFCGVIATRK